MIDTLGITVPVALHLDHGSYEGALKAMDDGFSSVMFDGSHYGIEENIEKTKEIIRLAAEKGISVEAEVGAIGGEEDGVVGGGEVADPDECKMIADLGVTMLAAGIGNIHGVYPENWQGLNFDVLAQIQEKTGQCLWCFTAAPAFPMKWLRRPLHWVFPKSMLTRVPARFCCGYP